MSATARDLSQLDESVRAIQEGLKLSTSETMALLRSTEHRKSTALEMAERYRHGKTFVDIAYDLGISRTTARSLVIEGGARPRPRGRKALPRPSHPGVGLDVGP